MPKDTFFNLPEEKRQGLTQALLEEFAENDYRSASVSRVVERAGIAKGSFYQYFEDKKDCYLYLLRLAVDEKRAFVSRIPPPEHGLDVFATLRWLLDTGASFEFSQPQLAKIGYRAVLGEAPFPDETLEMIRQGGMAYFRQLAAQGVAAGTIRPETDVETAAFVWNVIFMNLGQHLLGRFGMAPQELLERGAQAVSSQEMRTVIFQVLDILENGLRKR